MIVNQNRVQSLLDQRRPAKHQNLNCKRRWHKNRFALNYCEIAQIKDLPQNHRNFVAKILETVPLLSEVKSASLAGEKEQKHPGVGNNGDFRVSFNKKDLDMNNCFCDACLLFLPFLPALVCLEWISHQSLQKISKFIQFFK